MVLARADAAQLTAEREVADFYESVATSDGSDRARLAANWIVNDRLGCNGREACRQTAAADGTTVQDLLDAINAGECHWARRQGIVAAARSGRNDLGGGRQTQSAGA